jgi:carbon monoxide dehydrogenase subunit G
MSIRFKLSQQISASPERVFAALTELDGAAAWMPGLVRIERLTEGPMRVGSAWRETRKVMGKERTEEFEVTTLEAPWRFAVRCDGTKGTSKRGEYLFSFRLSPEGGRTRVELDAEIRALGPIMSLFGRLMVGMYRKMVAKDLQALHDYLGQAAPEPAGVA